MSALASEMTPKNELWRNYYANLSGRANYSSFRAASRGSVTPSAKRLYRPATREHSEMVKHTVNLGADSLSAENVADERRYSRGVSRTLHVTSRWRAYGPPATRPVESRAGSRKS